MDNLRSWTFATSTTPTLIGVGIVVIALLVWHISSAVDNLFFHPLARFPGPRSAAISQRWLRNASLTGRQEAIFEELHKRYGSRTLRIGPNELHISDPNLYKTIYSQDGQYTKEPYFYNSFTGKSDIFSTRDNQMHKNRRSMMGHCFSRTSLQKKQPMLHGILEKMRLRLQKHGSDRLVNMHNLCRLFPADVVIEFAFGETYDSMTKSDEEFCTPLLQVFELAITGLWGRMFSPTTQLMERLIPLGFLARFIPDMRMLQDWLDFVMDRVVRYQTRSVEKTASDDEGDEGELLLDSIKDLSMQKRYNEAITIIAAGADTTGGVLSYACWQLARNDTLRARLVKELDDIYASASPNPPDIPALESCHVLSAIIKETLRCGMAVPGRLPRVVPVHAKSPLTVDGVVIPPGTTVGISATTVHFSEELWSPDAREFRPDRWLEENTMAKASNLVTFSRGARNCIGQNLAMNEIHTFLAYVFRMYEVRLKAGPKELRLFDNFGTFFLDPYYVTMTPRVSGEL